jgi:hypothetical protein
VCKFNGERQKLGIYIEEASLRRFLEEPKNFFDELARGKNINRLRLNAPNGPFYIFTRRKFDQIIERSREREKVAKSEAEALSKEKLKLFNENRKLKLSLLQREANENKKFGISENLTQAQETFLKIKHRFKIFDEISDNDSLKILGNIVIKKFTKNESIFDQNDVGKEIYYVIQGSVDIVIEENQKRINVATIKSGNFFGEMAFIAKVPRRSASAINSHSRTVVLAFTVKEEMIEGTEIIYAKLYKNIVSFLASKLSNMNVKITRGSNNSN